MPDGIDRRVDLRFFNAPTQYPFHILQGLSRGALEYPFANKALHVQRCAADHQNPLSLVDGGCRQLAFRVLGVMHFNTGAPPLTLRRGVQQSGT